MGNSLIFSPIVLFTALGLLAGIAIVVFAPRILKATKSRDPALSRRKRAFLFATIAASLLLCLLAVALQAGYEDSPTGLHDSNGHALGHNEPLTRELARMVLANATLGSMVDALGWHGGLFLLLHLLAIAYLAGALRSSSGLAARFCWMQFVVFPLGWVGCLMLFTSVVDGEIDGEGLTDIPFWWTFQPLWLFAVALAGWWLQRASLAPAIGAPRSAREQDPS